MTKKRARKSLKQHVVKSHVREGKRVRSYIRGRQPISWLPKKSIESFKPKYLADILDELSSGGKTIEEIKDRLGYAHEVVTGTPRSFRLDTTIKSVQVWIAKDYMEERNGKIFMTPKGEKMYKRRVDIE